MSSRSRELILGALVASIVALVPSTVAAQSETIEYYAADALGSIRVVFTATGAIQGRIDYGPFGEQLTSAAGVGQKVFAKVSFDGESNMDYADARMYQPWTGRFNAPDPVYAGLFEPQRWNRYAYALNSPLTFVDPDGLLANSGMGQHCAAEYSYASCGGDDAFWGGGNGFEFGSSYARALDAGYVPGMPSEVWSSLQQFNFRAETAFTQAQQTSTTSQATVSTSTTVQLPDGSKVSPKDAPPLVQLVAGVADTTSLLTNPLTVPAFMGGSALAGACLAFCGPAVAAASNVTVTGSIWVEIRVPGLLFGSVEFAQNAFVTGPSTATSRASLGGASYNVASWIFGWPGIR